ncbi:hypothetical protein Pyn_13538 [Prunus yedoensis var. nudiflora]|uniref:Uncharacterized protein n=1 Tax=Prunus yedoensis var. nudiflora TaxID=2094558 RepID=A0A314YNP6_PRUYE|nr:hypothetical protein Pyn_13538 [Prunus yedoensis var. nudiflora]
MKLCFIGVLNPNLVDPPFQLFLRLSPITSSLVKSLRPECLSQRFLVVPRSYAAETLHGDEAPPSFSLGFSNQSLQRKKRTEGVVCPLGVSPIHMGFLWFLPWFLVDRCGVFQDWNAVPDFLIRTWAGLRSFVLAYWCPFFQRLARFRPAAGSGLFVFWAF